MKELYVDNEKYDQYARDQNVFAPGISKLCDGECVRDEKLTGSWFDFQLSRTTCLCSCNTRMG